MAQSSIFWDTNGTGDGTVSGYTEAQLAQFLQLFTQGADKSGVAPDRDNELAVSGTATPVAVASGSALVHGSPYFSTASENVTIPTPTTSTRIDRIVLRKSWAAQTIRITRIAGSEGGAAPSITQSDGTTWDFSLAQVSITTGGIITVTDERNWLSVVGDGDVVTAKLTDSAVTEAKIGAGAVTSTKLGDGAVTTTKIADDAVTTAKINAGAVTSTELGDGSVATAKIADDAVTQAKIADDAVGSAQIADDAVGAAHIADDAVDTAQIADGAVETAQINDGAVTQAKLGSDTLQMMILPIAIINSASFSNTSYSGASPYQGFTQFDKSRFPTGATVKLAACLQGSGGNAYCRAYDFSTGGIAGSEVSTSGGGDQILVSADFLSSIGSGTRNIGVEARTSAGTSYTYSAFLLVEW